MLNINTLNAYEGIQKLYTSAASCWNLPKGGHSEWSKN